MDEWVWMGGWWVGRYGWVGGRMWVDEWVAAHPHSHRLETSEPLSLLLFPPPSQSADEEGHCSLHTHPRLCDFTYVQFLLFA